MRLFPGVLAAQDPERSHASIFVRRFEVRFRQSGSCDADRLQLALSAVDSNAM